MRPSPRLTAALLGLGLFAASIAPAQAQVAVPEGPVPVEVPAPRAPLVVAGPAQPSWEPRGAPHDNPAVPVLIGVVAGFLAADVGFAIHDGVKAGHGEAPSRGVGIAQAVVAAPQVMGFGVFHLVASADGNGDDIPVAPLVFFPGLANSLFMHGVWASQTPSASPGVLLGVSSAVGFDTALTASILARAGTRHVSGRAMGVVQMVLTAPQIAASSYALTRDPGNTAGWAALTAWSGAIFAHGLVSAIFGGRSPQDDLPPPPPPPPPPVPEKPPLMVPASLHLGPVPMAGGGGIGLSGQWL